MPLYRIGNGEVVEAKPHRIHYIAQAKHGPNARVERVGTRLTQRIRKYGSDMPMPADRKTRGLFARIMASLNL